MKIEQKTNVYFTVDTESSMGGAWENPSRRPLEAARHVFCRIAGEEYGIPFQVRMLKEFGFRATFFVETLATRCLGEADTRSVFDYLLREGQDVQLHIHPNFSFYAERQNARARGMDYPVPKHCDLIGHLDEPVQMDLLGEAIRFFEKFAGYRPAAFRAGCYAGSRPMLRCLLKLGIRVDSSFNPCYHPELSFPDGGLSPNLVQQIEGVWEIPITVARTRLPEGYHGFKFADCTALSFDEIRQMLDSAASSGQRHFVMVFHSFSAVKTKDETYAEMRPNRIVIRRLERTFRYLSENQDRFNIEVMGNAVASQPTVGAASSPTPLADLGFVRASVRKAVQLLNRPYWV
jgi:hypothetical protein